MSSTFSLILLATPYQFLVSTDQPLLCHFINIILVSLKRQGRKNRTLIPLWCMPSSVFLVKPFISSEFKKLLDKICLNGIKSWLWTFSRSILNSLFCIISIYVRPEHFFTMNKIAQDFGHGQWWFWTLWYLDDPSTRKRRLLSNLSFSFPFLFSFPVIIIIISHCMTSQNQNYSWRHTSSCSYFLFLLNH